MVFGLYPVTIPTLHFSQSGLVVQKMEDFICKSTCIWFNLQDSSCSSIYFSLIFQTAFPNKCVNSLVRKTIIKILTQL